MATSDKKEYGAGQVKHLANRDAVRARPHMYLGEPGPACAWTVCREVLDNVVDEALNGHASTCEFIIEEDGSYWVHDDGRGMPVGMMTVEDSVSHKKHQVSALQAITGLLHAGAKLDANDAYSISRGTHGIGMKGTNFTSEYFEVWTKPKEGWHYICYKEGKVDGQGVSKSYAPEHPVLKGKLKSGTLVHFKPDAQIIGADKFPLSFFVEWAMVAAYFTKDFTIKATLPNGKTKTWHCPEGPKQYLTDQIAKLKVETVQGKPFVFINQLATVVAAFTGHDTCEMSAFTNGLRNVGRGKHFDSFFDSLASAIEPYRKARQKFTPSDLREGIVGLINVNLSMPLFGGQTKERLVDDRAGKPLKEMLQKALVDYFKANKSTAEWICARAQALSELKGKFIASKKVVSAIKNTRKNGLPAKAQTAPNCKPEQRELFLIEGDSAGGSAKNARDPKYQENLPLKGKIKNAWKGKDLESLLISEEVLNILTMIGYDPADPDPLSKLRVGKIVLLSDPDPDGPLHPDTLVPVFYEGAWQQVRIEDLADASQGWAERDYKVIAYNPFSDPPQRKLVRVNGVHAYKLQKGDSDVAITWSNGTRTVCTGEHRWVTARPESYGSIQRTVNYAGQTPRDGELQYLRADNLKAGDQIRAMFSGDDRSKHHPQEAMNPHAGATSVMVTKVRKQSHDFLRTFYCLDIPVYHNFMLANGVFSGNCHINSLELGLFARILPGLFDRGIIHVAEAPEFYAKHGKEYIFGASARELRGTLDKRGAPKSTEIHHVKGWGELPSTLLETLAYNPETRSLRRIVSDTASLKKFVSLMGDDAELRRELMGI